MCPNEMVLRRLGSKYRQALCRGRHRWQRQRIDLNRESISPAHHREGTSGRSNAVVESIGSLAASREKRHFVVKIKRHAVGLNYLTQIDATDRHPAIMHDRGVGKERSEKWRETHTCT